MWELQVDLWDFASGENTTYMETFLYSSMRDEVDITLEIAMTSYLLSTVSYLTTVITRQNIV